MNRARWLVVSLCACAVIASAQTGTITYEGFNALTNDFNQKLPILYSLPNAGQFGPGPYPVFLWIGGTFELYDDPLASFLMTEMNLRGFLAASVAYDNNEWVQTCSAYEPRAQGIFSSSQTNTAAHAVCSLSSANCNPANKGGIVLMGASQGGLLAVQAKNYNPNVQAVYAMSIGDYAPAAYDYFPCVDKSNTVLPSGKITVIDGQNDEIFQPVQPELQNITGLACPSGSIQCWNPDGSGGGWYIVQNSEVQSGDANHCYFISNSDCIAIGDITWMFGSENWSVGPNLDWLASFGTHRTFSSNGE
jgi:dienelactone hydrolase